MWSWNDTEDILNSQVDWTLLTVVHVVSKIEERLNMISIDTEDIKKTQIISKMENTLELIALKTLQKKIFVNLKT